MNKLQKLLCRALGVDQVEQRLLTYLRQEFLKNEEIRARTIAHLETQQTYIKHFQEQLAKQALRIHELETLLVNTRKLINVGIDVHDPRRDISWMVVMVKGPDEKHGDIVNFFDLKFEDYKYLKEVLKQLESTRRAIDLPQHIHPFIRREWGDLF